MLCCGFFYVSAMQATASEDTTSISDDDKSASALEIMSGSYNPLFQTPPGFSTSLLVGRLTKIGNIGLWVAQLQKDLNFLGTVPQLVTDGLFGPTTHATVRAFQAGHNLVIDGIVGPKTIAGMEAAYKQ